MGTLPEIFDSIFLKRFVLPALHTIQKQFDEMLDCKKTTGLFALVAKEIRQSLRTVSVPESWANECIDQLQADFLRVAVLKGTILN